MSEPQSETPEPFRIELIEAKSKLARCERELSTEREAKLEYLRRDAERNRQLVAEREARVKAERERDEWKKLADWSEIITVLDSAGVKKEDHGFLRGGKDRTPEDAVRELVSQRDTLRAKLASMEQERNEFQRFMWTAENEREQAKRELATLRATKGQDHGAEVTRLVDTSLLNNPARLRERADAIEAWSNGKPVDKFIDGKWIEIEDQTAFFFDRRYRARP